MARRTRNFRMEMPQGKDFGNLEKQLRKLDAAVQVKLLVKASLAGAEPIRQVASEKAPKRTGFLSKNIVKSLLEADQDHADVAIHPTKEAFYGRYQEVGTKHHRSRPFLRPAIDEQKEESIRVSAEVLRAGILEAARKKSG